MMMSGRFKTPNFQFSKTQGNDFASVYLISN